MPQYSYSKTQERQAINLYTEKPERKLAEIAKLIKCTPVQVSRILKRAGARETRPMNRQPSCHPDLKHYALGLCQRCYLNRWQDLYLDRASYMRRWRKRKQMQAHILYAATKKKTEASTCPKCGNELFYRHTAKDLFCPNCRYSESV